MLTLFFSLYFLAHDTGSSCLSPQPMSNVLIIKFSWSVVVFLFLFWLLVVTSLPPPAWDSAFCIYFNQNKRKSFINFILVIEIIITNGYYYALPILPFPGDAKCLVEEYLLSHRTDISRNHVTSRPFWAMGSELFFLRLK